MDTTDPPTRIAVEISEDGIGRVRNADAGGRLVDGEVAYVPASDWQPRPGVMHPVDQAFYDLSVKERNYERVKVDRLTGELDEAVKALSEIVEFVESIDGKADDFGELNVVTRAKAIIARRER